MKTLCISIFALIAGIILPAVVVATTPLTRTDAKPAIATQVKAPTNTASAMAAMPGCPMCPMMNGAEKTADMSPDMKQHCDMVMNAELSKDDAACLLGLKHELKLTPKQVMNLEQNVKESRFKAAAELTAEQHKYLAERSEHPMSMSQVHMKMHQMAQKKADAAADIPKNNHVEQPKAAASPAK